MFAASATLSANYAMSRQVAKFIYLWLNNQYLFK